MKLSYYDVIIDVETKCDIPISVGTYKYCKHPSLKVLLISLTFGDRENKLENVITIDLTKEELPDWFEKLLFDKNFRKHAHHAIFEMLCCSSLLGIDMDATQWYCSMACVAFCTLPLKLEESANLLMHDQRKLTTGNDLIKEFSIPTIMDVGNGKLVYIYTSPESEPVKWQKFIVYNKQDVLAEKKNLECLPEIPELFEEGIERDMWILDYLINSNGVSVNVDLAKKAEAMCEREDEEMLANIQGVGIDNMNSRDKVLKWLKARGVECTTLRAEDYDRYLTSVEHDEIARCVLETKKNLSLSSATKFTKFVETEINGKIFGSLQYYAAVRTGRWGGRGAQPQNLKKNDLPFTLLSLLRKLVLKEDYTGVKMFFGNVKESVTELCRTVVQPKEGNIFLPSDFSAIEARVTAYIAKEEWRLEVFRTHGKIYEASAAMMFKKNIEDIKKGSIERQKGKYAELALGFSGWVGAFKKFGADKFMTEPEMLDTAQKWRQASPNVVALWSNIEECAVNAVRFPDKSFETSFGAVYKVEEVDGRKWLTCKLPSGRRIMYFSPKLIAGRNGNYAISYKRLAKESDTWRGSLTENIVQAIARDLLVYKMVYLWKMYGIVPVLHVHDEIVYEFPKEEAEDWKFIIDTVMAMEVPWAKGLPLKGDTSVLPFYMKDND